MRVGNSELIRSFLILGLAVVILVIWVKSTVGGGIAGAAWMTAGDKPAFSSAAAALLVGVPLLMFVFSAAAFRHYGRLSPFVTKTYARMLLGGAMVASILAAAVPVAYLAHWIGEA